MRRASAYRCRPALAAATLCASLAGMALALPSPAAASSKQIPMIQDGARLQADPQATLAQFRSLGATTVRVIMFWYSIAPSPNASKAPNFNASDPDAYPSKNWARWDSIVRAAKAENMKIDFVVAGGAPLWADGPGVPSNYNPNKNKGAAFFAWKPNAKDYGEFVQAVGKRYSGSFTPKGESGALPRVSFWSIWNEPNFGEDLGPQATDVSRVSYAPMLYRNLVSAGYGALSKTGHGHDTILIGELAAHGSALSNGRPSGGPQGLPGNAGQTQPLPFLKTLYCLNSGYGKLSGSAASATGCPTTAAGRAAFRARNPGLFNASGVGDHAYANSGSPTSDGKGNSNWATFPNLGLLERTLDRSNGAYGSGKKYAIYNDEYGYITNPPHTNTATSVPVAKAALYLNEAEYISWKNPRIAAYEQYLLKDPPGHDGFQSGLYFSNGRPKATLNAYRLPIWMPSTSLHKGAKALVWGEARPAYWMGQDSKSTQSVDVQFKAGKGDWKTVATVKNNGYFTVSQAFASSGSVRLSYTYPKSDPFLPVGVAGSTITSRTVAITVH